MITSYLQGGLGNQMFQISAAYTLSRDINVDCVFDFDTCFTPAQGYPSNKYKNNFFKKINNQKLNLNSFKLYREPKFSYSELPKEDNLMLFGNFQSERYFSKYKSDILNLFEFSEDKKNQVDNFIKETFGNDSVTAVHVRRGDYLSNPNFHPTCSLEYYNQAMNLIGDGNFIFIADDINWCQNNFIGENIFYSPFTNEINDLLLLIMCNNHILANSSFSWWGAYMCNKNNKVIVPSNWFGPNGPQDTQDIYLDNWIKI